MDDAMREQLPLTLRVRSVVRAIFPPEQCGIVEQALIEDCGPVQVHSPDFDADPIERIWLAALKLSKGDIGKFEGAVLLARTDWRDLLMSADFGFDLSAHLRWAEQVLEG